MRTLLAALAATLLATTAQAVTIHKVKGFDTTIHVGGDINYGDEVYLADVLQQRRNEGKVTEYVMLDSPGGNIYSGHMMGKLIRENGIKTVVDGDAVCASACMLMFAAGVQRVAWVGAHLGVHGGSVEGQIW